MRKIYLAIRNLREELKQLPPELADAASNLQTFESMNRGHQNELDDLAMSAQDRRIELSQPTRRATLKDSMPYLISAAARFLSHRDSLSPALTELLALKDETGFLKHWFTGRLRGIADTPSVDIPGYWRHCSLHFTAQELRAELCLEYQRLGLKAYRTFKFEFDDLDTLEGCLKTSNALQARLKSLSKDIESWDEFATAKKQGALREQIRKKIEFALTGLNDEERTWLANNWGQAKPQNLSGTMLV
jgi:hypothetical protein